MKQNSSMIKGYIFDLDGVLVDTAKYHYTAWNKLAKSLGFEITEEENENLKGVSRMESLEYILGLGNVDLSKDEKLAKAALKNEWYVEFVKNMDSTELLPGAKKLLDDLKMNNIKIALGSASKNSVFILKNTGIIDYFDVIIDGTKTTESKPHPQVFLMGAEGLGLKPEECIVFEDSIKGIEAANTGGMISIGVGEPETLSAADFVIPNLQGSSVDSITTLISN